jgi:hypothetical protein
MALAQILESSANRLLPLSRTQDVYSSEHKPARRYA